MLLSLVWYWDRRQNAFFLKPPCNPDSYSSAVSCWNCYAKQSPLGICKVGSSFTVLYFWTRHQSFLDLTLLVKQRATWREKDISYSSFALLDVAVLGKQECKGVDKMVSLLRFSFFDLGIGPWPGRYITMHSNIFLSILKTEQGMLNSRDLSFILRGLVLTEWVGDYVCCCLDLGLMFVSRPPLLSRDLILLLHNRNRNCSNHYEGWLGTKDSQHYRSRKAAL